VTGQNEQHITDYCHKPVQQQITETDMLHRCWRDCEFLLASCMSSINYGNKKLVSNSVR